MLLNSTTITIKVSNSLDKEQVHHFVWPDLDQSICKIANQRANYQLIVQPARVKSDKFGHQVNSDAHLQTV